MFTLKVLLRANAVSCLLFGGGFLLWPEQVGAFLSNEAPAPAWVLMVTGGLLLVNGLHLWWVSYSPVPAKHLVLQFSYGDFAWVGFSILLVIAGIWITSLEGIIASLIVALMVGLFGYLQLKTYADLEQTSSAV